MGADRAARAPCSKAINRMSSPLPPFDQRLWRFPDGLVRRGDRFRASVHLLLRDHGFLRLLWTNTHSVAPGVWRSNQPTPRRLARWQKMGVRTVLNLRGADDLGAYALESATCAALGMALIDHPMAARKLHPPETYLALLDIFDGIERPFVMHCKSGADRAGLASALYLLHIEGASPQAAAQMLSLRFMHLRQTKTGILDAFLAAYAADHRATGIPIRDWIATRYDPDQIRAGFKPLYRFG